MKAMKNSISDTFQFADLTTYHIESDAGDRLVVTINPTGLTVIQAKEFVDHISLDSLIVVGLTAEQASTKSKGFWGRLWDKIKKAAGDVIEAFTFDAGPLSCKPHAKVDFHGDKPVSFTVGLTCND